MLSAVFHGYNLYKMKGEGGVLLGQKRATRERKLLGQCPLVLLFFHGPPAYMCESTVCSPVKISWIKSYL